MSTCRTSVSVRDPQGQHLHFKACGKPAKFSVQVGHQLCEYCREHAEAANRHVKARGQAAIKATQDKTLNGPPQ